MVNFTCNTCGDSLKKKDVVVHFTRSLKCRNAVSLTCFDCLKVFGQDYISHTSCVSENQRYSANGLSGIQKTKQQIREELISKHLRSLLETEATTLTGSVKNLINYIIDRPNIPRKEKAYMNFIRNCGKFNDKDAATVWSIVKDIETEESKQPKPKADKPPKSNSVQNNVSATDNTKDASPKGKKKKKQSTLSDAVEAMDINNAADESVVSEGNIGEKSKKKKKKSKSVQANTDETKLLDSSEIENGNSESEKPSKKKQKSESNGLAETNGGDENTTMDVEPAATGEPKVESKKEKKLKKKREKYEAEKKALEMAAAMNVDEEIEEEPATQETGKKKKSKKLQAAEVVEESAAPKGKSKRQRTESMIAEIDHPKKKNKGKENDENAGQKEEAADVDESRAQKDFNWADVIVKVLQSQNDQEMPIKRLCKKVVNEYLSSLLEGAHVDEVKATAKFQKKLHKTPGVFVHKDKAKLKSSE